MLERLLLSGFSNSIDPCVWQAFPWPAQSLWELYPGRQLPSHSSFVCPTRVLSPTMAPPFLECTRVAVDKNSCSLPPCCDRGLSLLHPDPKRRIAEIAAAIEVGFNLFMFNG